MYNTNGQAQILTYPYIMALPAIGVIVGAVIYNKIKADANSLTDDIKNSGSNIINNAETKTTELINNW